MLMLTELCKKDSQWRRISLKICRDKMLADDIVQEMYIKLSTIDKQINDFYVILTMKSIFINYTKKQNFTDLNFDIPTEEQYELSDEDMEIIDSLTWVEKGYLELSTEMSLREIGKELNTNYAYIYRTIKNAKEKINGQTKKTI